jgi:antitoxin (DNA-binding transcriptional repressor) of toxin-antitoxin stability system
MQATIVDLRYHMKNVLEALERGEEVTVIYHRRPIASITPLHNKINKIAKTKDNPFFGMLKADGGTVENQMDKLRGV